MIPSSVRIKFPEPYPFQADDSDSEAVLAVAAEGEPPEPKEKPLAARVKDRLVRRLAEGPKRGTVIYLAARIVWAILRPAFRSA